METTNTYTYNDPQPANMSWYRQCKVLGIKAPENMTLGEAKTLVARAIGGDSGNSSCYQDFQRPTEDWQEGPMKALGETVTETTTVHDFKEAMKRHGFRVYQTLYSTMKHLYHDKWIEYDPYEGAIVPSMADREAIVAYVDSKTCPAELAGQLREDAPKESDLRKMLVLHKQVSHILWDKLPEYADKPSSLVIRKEIDGLQVKIYFQRDQVKWTTPEPQRIECSTVDEILEKYPMLNDSKWSASSYE